MSDLIKGKGLVLVTGKKGSGKSHFVTNQIKKIVDKYPEHQVYADIDGLAIDGVLKSPEDWQTVDNNCTIVYDEAQRLPWADNSSSKINSDSRVREMTMIRHQNKNIVLITQDPMFIHSALRKLVDVHYHFSHPFKDGKPKCFVFHGAMANIDDKGVYQNHAVETFTYELDKETAKLYKSVDDNAQHDQKKTIPKRIKYMIIFIICLIVILIPLGIIGIKLVGGFIMSADERGQQQMQQTTKQESTTALKTTANTMQNGVSVQTTQPQTLEDYERIKRQEQQKVHQKYLEPYTIEVGSDDLVLPASIISYDGKCRAYNRYGDGLNLSQAECKNLLENPHLIPKRRLEKQEYRENNQLVKEV